MENPGAPGHGETEEDNISGHVRGEDLKAKDAYRIDDTGN
jgi:hypothetical protein